MLLKLFLLIGLAGLVLYYGPQISIWAVNTLFHTAIPQTWSTWFATLWLSGVMGGVVRRKAGVV